MAQKIVFQMDAAGLYAGITEADESPLEPGTFHVPRGCVEEGPHGLAVQVDDAGRATGWTASWPDDKWPRWRGAASLGWELIPRPIIPKQAEPQPKDDPIGKLRAFLDANPDVAQMMEATQN